MKKFGYFDDNRREYVITVPQTPYPWINYLGTKDFFSLISNTAGGYCFYKDARLRRITRYRYNNVPLDSGGRYFYINEQGDVWSPGWKPVKALLEKYECRHGMNYTIINGMRNGLEVEVLFFVPLHHPCEIHRVKLTNHGNREKTFTLFSFIEWCLWNAYDDMTNFQRNFSTGEVEIEGNAIYHKTEYRERRNHYAFYWVNEDIAGFDTDREIFLGLYNGFENPAVVFNGKSLNSVAHGWSPIASHSLHITLAPEESRELVFILGYVENDVHEKFIAPKVINKEKAFRMQQELGTPVAVRQAFDELKTYWDRLLSIYTLQSPDDKLNRMVNSWNPYQCMITFNFSRSASYFESGIGRGMGFRDSNQDIIGFVHMEPQQARQRIIDLASTQMEDGSAYHQYQPLTKKGNHEIGSNFNDDPLWLILSVTAYLKETGDFSILEEKVPYNNDASKAAPLLDHLKRSFYHVVHHRGPHGLPLIGRADWNDCLNLNCFSTTCDESFQTTENKEGGVAESIFIAAMFVLYGQEYVDLCHYLGHHGEAEVAAKYVEEMKQVIEKYGWDGEWFLRAYNHFGEKIGSKECEEGKIFIETQGFCVMAGIGLNNGKAKKALESVKKYLDCPYGLVLNYPAFSSYRVEMGEISTYPEGYKENGGIFCHNNPWVMIAETMTGNGARAFEYYKKIAPAYLEDISELHKTEPYVYAQMIAGKEAYQPGEAKNSWLTGTAAWNYYAVSQYILGIRPHYDGLIIDPCIPPEWKEYSVNRKFRGKKFEIIVRNPQGVSKGVKSVLLNGKPLNKNFIPADSKGDSHRVEVWMG